MNNFRVCNRSLFAMSRGVRRRMALYCLLGLASVACSLFFVWVCKHLVDIATGRIDEALLPYFIIMVAVMVAQRASNIAMARVRDHSIVKACNRNRSRLFGIVMRSTWDGKDKMHSGDVVSRIGGDVDITSNFLCSVLPQSIITLAQLAASAAYMFILQPQLTWILLIIMPVAVVASKLFFKPLRTVSEAIRASDSLVQQHVQENLQNRILLRSLGALDRVSVRMDCLQDDVERNNVRRLNYLVWARSFISFGFMCGYALVFIWSVCGISKGVITYGMMTAFLQLVGQVQRPVADFSAYIPAYIRALASSDRIVELENLVQEERSDDVLLNGAPGVKVENLSFAYPGQEAPVLEGFSHFFKPGGSTAVMGPTGVGKSTLIRIILSLLEPQSGSISLVEADGREHPCDGRTRCNFMYVPQGNSLMSGTIRQNLQMAAPDASDDELFAALHIAAADFVKELPAALDTECSEKGGGLSEGQAQRIAIARALLHRGGVLILDEATSSLDSETESALLERVSAYCRGCRTVICITHREAAARYTDDCLHLG